MTGATGSLGRVLVPVLLNAGYGVRVTSRHEWVADHAAAVERIRADLATGAGVREAVEGMDVVIHDASDPRRAQLVDVEGTRRLAEAARRAGVAHFVYVSIVGVDQIPFRYYRAKWAAEGIVRASGVPFTIARATQFHSLIDRLLAQAARVPWIMPVPFALKFQPGAEIDAAMRLARCAGAAPLRDIVSIAGPEILTLGEMAKTWMEVRGIRKRLVNLPVAGGLARAFREGKATAASAVRGTVRWNEWLARRGRSGTVDVSNEEVGTHTVLG